MPGPRFLDDFGHWSWAPGGTARLREMILHVALSGKLAEPQSNDSNVIRASAELARRREQVLLEQGISAARKHRSLETARSWLRVPNHWTWEYLGHLSVWPLKDGDWIESKAQDPGGDVRIIQLADIGVGVFKNCSSRFLTAQKARELNCYYLQPNDVLIARLPEPLGRACLFPGDKLPCVTVVDVAVCRCDPRIVDPAFLMICINSPAVLKRIRTWETGTTRGRVATGRLGLLALPLPPIEEQRRIATKVADLMARCDQFEGQHQTGHKVRTSALQSTVQGAAMCPRGPRLAWTRLQDNFEGLFKTPDDLRNLKSLILDLAVSGELLTPEMRVGPTGSALLQKIASARVVWSESREARESKEAQAMTKKLSAQQIAAPDVAIPDHWTWGSLLQISQVVVDCHNKTAPYVGQGIHLVRTADIRDGQMDLSNTRRVSAEVYSHWARRLPPKPGDIVFTREAPMGEAAIVPEGATVCLGQRTMLIRLFPNLFSNAFLLYVLRSPSFRKRMSENAIGLTVKHLRIGDVEDLVVPVPPKEEQDRLVAVIDTLFKQCDRLAGHLNDKLTVAERWVRVTAAEMSGAAVKREAAASVKAPHTEPAAMIGVGDNLDIRGEAILRQIFALHASGMTAKDLWSRVQGPIDAFYAQLKIEGA